MPFWQRLMIVLSWTLVVPASWLVSGAVHAYVFSGFSWRGGLPGALVAALLLALVLCMAIVMYEALNEGSPVPAYNWTDWSRIGKAAVLAWWVPMLIVCIIAGAGWLAWRLITLVVTFLAGKSQQPA